MPPFCYSLQSYETWSRQRLIKKTKKTNKKKLSKRLGQEAVRLPSESATLYEKTHTTDSIKFRSVVCDLK